MATAALVVGLADNQDMIVLFILGTLGSLLPDIDSDNSIPIQVAFTFISMLAAFTVMFSLIHWFASVAELLVIWFSVFILCRSVIFALFTQLTTHRGIFHSLPAALFFCFITTILTHQIWQFDNKLAWLAGCFIAFGFIVHLVLDEIYSVNLFGLKSKKSFGTAFKLYYSKSWPASIYMYGATITLFFFTPEWSELESQLAPIEFWKTLSQSFLPNNGWFTPKS